MAVPCLPRPYATYLSSHQDLLDSQLYGDRANVPGEKSYAVAGGRLRVHFLLNHHDHFHIDLSDQGTHGNPPGYDWEDERAANDFAAAVLMPSSMVTEHYEEDGRLEALARKFKVSREAMGWRLVSLGLLS